LEMDDIDMMLALIEMARDKLTKKRIARSQAGAKANRSVHVALRKSNPTVCAAM
jgi:hypothetical protein